MSKALSNRLQSLFQRYNRSFLPDDPVALVHRYPDPRDKEVAGLITALLAFGNAKAIQGSTARILQVMGPRPSLFVETFEQSSLAFRSLGHRWVRGDDLSLLLQVLKKIGRRHSSLKNFFLSLYQRGDPDIAPLLDRLALEICRQVRGCSPSRGFRYFFPSPKDGSPCKRLNMFLRWMVRPADGIDLGLWPEIPPSKLVIPLDTHLFRFAQRFRLSRYRSPTWRVAREVTDFLKRLDPEDPVKYDFAICHYGMEIGW